MELHTQIYTQLITMSMEDGTIMRGIVLYKMVHNIDFIDILEKLLVHVLLMKLCLQELKLFRI